MSYKCATQGTIIRVNVAGNKKNNGNKKAPYAQC